MKNKLTELSADVVIIGGGTGGTLAAYSAAKSGRSVIIAESTDWLGGQFTSQAVPSDEHRQIERQGCTRTYRDFRNNLRARYYMIPELKKEQRENKILNPGGGLVSPICAEPKIILDLLLDLLKPYTDNGKIKVLYNATAVSAKVKSDIIESVTVKTDGGETVLKGKYFLDATDCGDLLPIAGVEYRSGAEAKSETGELHAADIADPHDMQPVTHCAVIDYNPKQNEASTVAPPEYEFFKKQMWPCDPRHSVLSFYAPALLPPHSRRFGIFANEVFDGEKFFPLFEYRQIVKSDFFEKGYQPYDMTVVNWSQNDYIFDNIFGTEDDEYHKYMARQQTLAMIHWFNTEAVTASGKVGYRGFNLRGDMLDTKDGLAKAPYIRESRRIVPLKTITQEMISKENNKAFPVFEDSVGVGSYHIDVHMTTKSRRFFFREAQPFEIPLSALIPVRVKNLLAASKNIGTTHVTNGCYRLHPIEWNIGEAVGYLTAFCLSRSVLPANVYRDKKMLKEFQELLVDNGIQLHWKAWE